MEHFLEQHESSQKKKKTLRNDSRAESSQQQASLQSALDDLAAALRDVVPILGRSSLASTSATARRENDQQYGAFNAAEVIISSPTINAAWLLNLCAAVPSELGAAYLAQSIWDISSSNSNITTTDEAQQQAGLFDVLGASEQAMAVLMEVMPVLSEIRRKIQRDELLEASSSMTNHNSMPTSTTYVDLQEERRQLLLQEAVEAAQLADLARLVLEQSNGYTTTASAMTHSVLRQSDRDAQKQVDKLAKKAAQALARAKEAGAIVDGELFWKLDAQGPGPGGLMTKSVDELETLQDSLLASGSKQYYNDKGLPVGTIFEKGKGFEKVIIPAARRDESKLPARLKISDIMDESCQRAFDGTMTLNPMQSAVFDVAFWGRENILVCAPTGAGKTNVAMLTVVSHFRDVGLMPGATNNDNLLEAGRKVVYIAPMKALAQEVVEKFSAKLKPLRLIVRELTGDMQLTRAEADSANVIVTTPEKWDVITRKSGTDELSLGNQCGLLIIDEVHLLADERGAVIESVVARHHRLVEARQRQLRIVALSATLPNYEDVATFLQVPERGTFFFGPEHRPVPLQQSLIGISAKERHLKEAKMNEMCYDIVMDSLRRGYQVMVFVHSRKGTGDTARALADLAANDGTLESQFVTAGKDGAAGDAYSRYRDKATKSRDRQVGMHFQNGMGIHHAGMLRGDRKLTENMFADGAIKVLCCTAVSTLAWGINLPAHSVVIKGTEVYNPEKGGAMDLSILDVQQIFGRAGRPQFDSSGEATLITTYEAYQRYITKLVRAVPIESNFIKQLPDHLNAEIVGGTVSSVKEAVQWLGYTYLHIRMLRNPLAYGIKAEERSDDTMLVARRKELVVAAAKHLAATNMVVYAPESGNLSAKEMGRTAAHFYVQSDSVATFNEQMGSRKVISDAGLVRAIASASEFQNMRVLQEELEELQKIAGNCPLSIKGAGLDDAGRGLITSSTDKAFLLIQAFVGRERINSFTLISDVNYISANAGRIARALFEMRLKGGDAASAMRLLRIAKSIDNRFWWFQSPLRHFEGEIRENCLFHLDGMPGSKDDVFASTVSLLDMHPKEVGDLCRWNKGGEKIQSLIRLLPRFKIDCRILPITGSILRFRVTLTPEFNCHGRWHGGGQSFWLWIENTDSERIYHFEHLTLTKTKFSSPITVDAVAPIFDESGQFLVKIISDSWCGVEQIVPISVDESQLPRQEEVSTKLQNLAPLPTSVLQNPAYEKLYSFLHALNPIQTQLFHVLYHMDCPVLLGAPTGSGKTIVAELALLRMKQRQPTSICVYIAPLKALARERLKEWQRRLGAPPLNWNVLELSGDTHYDSSLLERSDVLVCTPEKWDLLSRGWRGFQTGEKLKEKSFVKRVGLLVLDEVHLLGEERGAVLEAIVSRTRFISRLLHQHDGASAHEGTRIIGLSTSLSNAIDLAAWMGIETDTTGPSNRRGLFNFSQYVRPVPITVHIQGFSGKHYCPRMATMNKPCYAAIMDYAPTKPTLIFVASRRQTRLTAIDLISYAASDEASTSFLDCSEDYIESVADSIRDESLRHTLTYGIGLHHAGLSSADRDVVEKLFSEGRIRVLVATATLAWGLNLPARLVIVKGTEYFDGKTSRYVDYPLTDVLQMIGRAGRPGLDTVAFAVVMSTEDKKNFYKKFLYNSFPVESCLKEKLCENINAEVASGTIASTLEALGYLSWTFFARRVKANPSYYGAKSSDEGDVEDFLFQVVNMTLTQLAATGCIAADTADGENTAIRPLPLGIACASHYLNHRTPKQMQFGIREGRRIVMNCLSKESNVDESSPQNATLLSFKRSMHVDEIACAWLLYALCSTHEFDEHPVRHNEEYLNEELSHDLMWGPDTTGLLSSRRGPYNIEIFQDSHTKCFLLLQAYMERTKLPITDYVNDTMSVVDNVPRLLGAMEYLACSDKEQPGSFDLVTQFYRTRQFISTRTVPQSDPLSFLPGMSENRLSDMKGPTVTVRELRAMSREAATDTLSRLTRIKKKELNATVNAIYRLPLINLKRCAVSHQVEKSTGRTTGKLELELEIERHKDRNGSSSDREVALAIVVGSYRQKMLMDLSSIRLNRFGKFNIARTVDFDWNRANADGGADGGKVIVRLLFDKVRGLDAEMTVALI